MYSASVPVLARALRQLRHVLQKGELFARERGLDPAVVLQGRLFPDMFPLVRQVQIATDIAKNGVARLAGVDPLRFEDDETDFAQLDARLERAIGYIEGFPAAQFEGSQTRAITVSTRSRGDLHFDGHAYLLGWVLPNVYFHVTTAYALLRHIGVPVGKADYLGPAPQG